VFTRCRFHCDLAQCSIQAHCGSTAGWTDDVRSARRAFITGMQLVYTEQAMVMARCFEVTGRAGWSRQTIPYSECEVLKRLYRYVTQFVPINTGSLTPVSSAVTPLLYSQVVSSCTPQSRITARRETVTCPRTDVQRSTPVFKARVASWFPSRMVEP
jgi:hypothetical protein